MYFVFLILSLLLDQFQDCKIFICGNKIDMHGGGYDCDDNYEMAIAMARLYSSYNRVFFTSAKTGSGIENLFDAIKDEIIKSAKNEMKREKARNGND